MRQWKELGPVDVKDTVKCEGVYVRDS
jgi:hypothetical protein